MGRPFLRALGEDVPEDWRGAADEDGKLRANTLSFLRWVACAADMGEMGYWQPVAAIGNYIARLAPGQSQTVRMAWIVNEGDLAHMALDLAGGASYAFSEEARACGLVDLRVQ